MLCGCGCTCVRCACWRWWRTRRAVWRWRWKGRGRGRGARIAGSSAAGCMIGASSGSVGPAGVGAGDGVVVAAPAVALRELLCAPLGGPSRVRGQADAAPGAAPGGRRGGDADQRGGAPRRGELAPRERSGAGVGGAGGRTSPTATVPGVVGR